MTNVSLTTVPRRGTSELWQTWRGRDQGSHGVAAAAEALISCASTL
jgi:hypothetical protein